MLTYECTTRFNNIFIDSNFKIEGIDQCFRSFGYDYFRNDCDCNDCDNNVSHTLKDLSETIFRIKIDEKCVRYQGDVMLKSDQCSKGSWFTIA